MLKVKLVENKAIIVTYIDKSKLQAELRRETCNLQNAFKQKLIFLKTKYNK